MTTAEQIASFLDKFDPAMAKSIKVTRAALRKRFPTAFELVYDNYNFLVFGFCTQPRASNAILSLAANAKGMDLMFYWGSTLPDPHEILLGGGVQNRFVRLESAATLDEPGVQALIDAAVAQAKVPLPLTGKGETIIKSISPKQRPRR